MERAYLADEFRKIVSAGDTVMLHSSYKSLGGVDGGPQAVIDALMDAAGPEGTVLLPTFTIRSWCEEHYFDYLETPGETGIIGEFGRQRPDAWRTHHPMFSFAVLGAGHEKYYTNDVRDAFGPRSIFDLFYQDGGLIVSLGVLDFNSTFTFVHYVERAAGCSHRRRKTFAGLYVDEYGNASLRTYSMFVRATQRHRTEVNPASICLYRQGVIGMETIGPADAIFARARDYFDAMAVIVRERPNKLYEVR